MADYKYVTYEELEGGEVVRILLNRPETRNAQNRGLLVDLDDAMGRAEEDDKVRVVILGGVGPLFSSGHDMGSKEARAEREPGPNQHHTSTINGATRKGAEARMLQEWHYFFQNTLRWRNLRKITVAQVQGTVYSAGLMLMWACDLIVAADDVYFADVVGTRLGMCGMEYFGHPWEFGPRRTKEMMLTGDAKVPTMTALMIKESVNQTVDNMGFYNSLQACFTLHQLNHSHWAEIHESKYPVAEPDDGIPNWKDAPPVRLAVPDAVEGPVPSR
jgi:enoyl-CoA hydratase